MYDRVNKPKENKARAVTDSTVPANSNVKQGFGFVDNRPKNKVASKLQKNEKEAVSGTGDCLKSCSGNMGEKISQFKMIANPDNLKWQKTGVLKSEVFSTIPNPHVVMDQMSDTTLPGIIPGMNEAITSDVIKDPSRGNRQRLTKMHMVRGKFGGPGSVINLKLGTASSNNGGAGSHTREVEYPIQEYIQGSSGFGNKRGVSYNVSVGDGTVPKYLLDRAKGNVNVLGFLNNWCPSTFDCRATYFSYWPDNTNTWQWWQSEEQKEDIRLDIGV
jgi:hypothetical protein